MPNPFTPPSGETDSGTGNAWYTTPRYSSTRDYSIGDWVRYGDGIYKCVFTIIGGEAWNPAHWEFKYTAPSSGSGSGSGSGSYDTKTCKLVINYNANGASGTPPSQQVATYSGEKKEVTLTQTVVGQRDLTWSGHYFLGWSENSSSSQPTINQGYKFKIQFAAEESGTVTKNLWAIWNANGRIVYKPGRYAIENSYSWHDIFQGLNATGNVTLKGNIFTRKGYTISGWLKSTSHFADINENVPVSSLLPESDLYPEWEPNKYTVTFKANDASLSQSDIVWENVPYDSTKTIPGPQAFTKTGYHISFWNEKADGTGAVWFPGKEYLYTVDHDVTLYAQWSGNEYNVLYCSDAESAQQVSSLQDSNLIEEYSIATYGSPFYTDYRPKNKENNSFDGWMSKDGIRLTKKDVWMDAYSLGSNSVWSRTSDLILYPIWSGAYPFGKIFFGRKSSSDYNIIVTEPPSYYWPEHSYEHKNIKGKNGDIITDNNYYKNVSKKYAVASYVKNDPALSAKNISDFLHRYDGHEGYIRLEDSYEPDIYMLGIYEESNEMESIVGQAWKTDIEFSCKPQKYLMTGNRKIDVVQSGAIIHNPTSHPAYPLIHIWGTGDIHFLGRPLRLLESEKTASGAVDDAELKDVTLTIYSNYNRVTFDAETFNAVDISGNNVNTEINLEDRVALYPGDNEITFAGEIQKISIIPRWWRI